MTTATAHNQNNFLQHDPNNDWSNQLQQYQETKNTWKAPIEPYVKRTHKDHKARETLYNPITQQFNDRQVESHISRLEKDNFVDVIAKNKDRALRYEQTFDIITFDNKLKGLESNPDYPKDKPWYFRPGKDTHVDYNILSNVAMKDHHFNPPDKRPQLEEEKKAKIKKTTTTGLRDYNVITGRYLELHEEKLKVDQEIQRAEGAHKYWQTHKFDPVNCQYYDQDQEKEYSDKRGVEQKEHGKDQVKKLPISVQNEGLLYNPINMKIEDENRLYQRDLREKNKRQRFEVRYDVEAKTRKDGLGDIAKHDEQKLNKISHLRYKEEYERGFDILTNDPLSGPEASKPLFQPQIQKPKDVWTKAITTVNKEFMTEDERRFVEREEEQRKNQSQQDFHKTQVQLLQQQQQVDPLGQTNFAKRSERVAKLPSSQARNSQTQMNEYQNQAFSPLMPSSQARQTIQADYPTHNPIQRMAQNRTPNANAVHISNGLASHNSMSRASASVHSAASSNRQIRTGGFQKLGQNIAIK